MGQQWYVLRGRERYGPLTLDRLSEMAAAGGLLPADLVQKVGSRNAVPARVVVGMLGGVASGFPQQAGQPKADGTDRDQPRSDPPSSERPSRRASAARPAGTSRLIAGLTVAGSALLLALFATVAVFVIRRPTDGEPHRETVGDTTGVTDRGPTPTPPESGPQVAFPSPGGTQSGPLTVTAQEIAREYEAGGAAADQKYRGRQVVISGVVARPLTVGKLSAVSFRLEGDGLHAVVGCFREGVAPPPHLVSGGSRVTLRGECRGRYKGAAASLQHSILLTDCEMDGGSGLGGDNQAGTRPVGPPAQPAGRTEVLVKTTMGELRIELFPDKAPITVENFLSYVEDRFYDGTIVHRVVPNFTVQGGGYGPGMRAKGQRPPFKNEAGNGLSNTAGTVAMARASADDPATSQFYVNLGDNSRVLDRGRDRDGFGKCVFGRVVEGMDVVERIGRVRTVTKGKDRYVPAEDVTIISIRRVD